MSKLTRVNCNCESSYYFFSGITSQCSDFISSLSRQLEQDVEITVDSQYGSKQLFFVYSIVPHRIVRAVPTAVYSEMTAHTIFLTTLEDEDNTWAWGEMRGGTPAIQIDEAHFLAFFHSSGHFNMQDILTYCMGAYLFESKPPFAITHVSPEPIVAKPFINESYGWTYKSVDFVVFPMGFFFDDHFIYVSCGKNDREGWAIKLNKSGLLASLRPVRSRLLGSSVCHPNGSIVPNSFKLVVQSRGTIAAAAPYMLSFATVACVVAALVQLWRFQRLEHR